MISRDDQCFTCAVPSRKRRENILRPGCDNANSGGKTHEIKRSRFHRGSRPRT